MICGNIFTIAFMIFGRFRAIAFTSVTNNLGNICTIFDMIVGRTRTIVPIITGNCCAIIVITSAIASIRISTLSTSVLPISSITSGNMFTIALIIDGNCSATDFISVDIAFIILGTSDFTPLNTFGMLCTNVFIASDNAPTTIGIASVIRAITISMYSENVSAIFGNAFATPVIKFAMISAPRLIKS